MTTTAFSPVDPQSHNAHASTRERGLPMGLAYHRLSTIVDMPVPAPSRDARAVVTGSFTEHRRGAGHRAGRPRPPPDHHGTPRGCAERAGDRLTEPLRRERRGAPRSISPTRPSARKLVPTSWPSRNISILCANAGTATFGPVAALDPADEKTQVQLNVLGVHDLTLAVLPGMVERGAGGILISGSVAGNSPIPNNATYAATQGVRQHVQRVAARRAEEGRRACHAAGSRPRAYRPCPTAPRHRSSTSSFRISCGSQPNTPRSCRWTALERNKMRVVPGMTSKAMSVASGYAPRAIVAPIVGAFYKKLGGD